MIDIIYCDLCSGKVFGPDADAKGWYFDTAGVNWTLWPLDCVSYWWRTRQADLADYTLRY